MILEFGEWLPDLPKLRNPGSTVATNVIPSALSYEQMPGLVAYSSNAMDARCQGAVFGKDPDGNSFIFSGNATKLYRRDSDVLTNVSKVGGYNTPVDGWWNFNTFGSRMLATNFVDAIQTYTMGTSTVFADLSAGAPKARYITSMNNFVIVGGTFDATDGNQPERVRWCALDDPTDWVVSPTTQADFQDLDSSKGWVQGVEGGDFATVWQERAISRMEYVGSPYIFRFTVVERGRGLWIPNSKIPFGTVQAYCALDGFYIFDGTQSVPIGEGKINKYFLRDFDPGFINNVSATYWPGRQLLGWLYPGQGNSGGIPNKLLLFNYASNAKMRWTICEVDAEALMIYLSAGFTLDSLDAISGSLDDLPYSLDSRFWTGDTYSLGAFDTNHKLANFQGDAMDATIETTEGQILEGQRAEVTNLKPLVEGSEDSTITIQIGERDLLTEDPTWTSAIPMNTIGECDARSNARFHRARVNISGGFDHATGVEVLEVYPAGKR
jgi:hypothetical protein